jgi:hypothetical protein
MIRLACPGCGAKYRVEDARACKATRCKRCRTKFLVPPLDPPPHTVAVPFDPLGGRPVPTLLPQEHPKPPVVEDEWATPPQGTPRPSLPDLPPPKPQGVEIAPCPGCCAQLTVPPDDLGSNVQCPHCHTVFAAVKPGAIVAPVADAEVVPPRREADEPDPRPARRGRAKVGGLRTIASVGVLSAAKMSGAMCFVIGLIWALLYGFFTLIIFLIGSSVTGDARILGVGVLYTICFLVALPFIYGVSGFLGGAVGALIYNLLATMIGGVEVELE